MKKQIRYTLGKQDRLKSRKAIEQIFAKGKSFSIFPFKVIYIKKDNDFQHQDTNNKQPVLQAAFSVSKRYFKKAVQRNRIKRLMREAYRLQKTTLQTDLHQKNKSLEIFILYIGNELPEYTVVFSKMDAVLARLQKIINEQAVTNI